MNETEKKQSSWNKKVRVGKRVMTLRRLVVASCIAVAVVLGASIGVYAATAPAASIVGYSDRATNNLRTSELLEVNVSGFASDAQLEFNYTISGWTYSSRNGEYIYFYDVPNLSEATYTDTKVASGTTLNWTTSYRWFAFSGTEANNAQISVTVKDKNPESKTFGKTASCSYQGLAKSDFKKDLEAGSYAMFYGSSKVSLRDIYGSGGLNHVSCFCVKLKNLKYVQGSAADCANEFFTYSTKMPWPFDDIEYTDYFMTPQKAGIAKVIGVNVDASAPDCTFHTNQTCNATTYIRIYNQVESTSTLRTITLDSGTEKGVTYTINGESQTCKEDGEKLTFGVKAPLAPDTTYNCELSSYVNGKQMKTSVPVKTSNTCQVTFDNNGVSNITNCVNEYFIQYKTSIKTYKEVNAPVAYGYDFGGWYDNPSCSGENYMNKAVEEDSITLYAKWTPKTYKVTVHTSLDGNQYSGARLSLVQNGKSIYNLSEITSTATTTDYNVADVKFSSYQVKNGTTYSYDLYINGRDSGLDIFLDGEKATGSKMESDVYCTTFYVDLTLNENPWSAQKVILDNRSDTTYTLSDAGVVSGKERYSYIFAYDSKTPENINDYKIYVNDSLVQDWTSAEMKEKATVQLSLEGDAMSEHGVAMGFYRIMVDVQKDNKAWKDAVVTLKQNGAVMETLIYKQGEYQALVSSKYPYDLIIDDVYTGVDTGEDVSVSNKELYCHYNTVQFVDSTDARETYYEQIIQTATTNQAGEGDVKRARKPTAPYKEGKTFTGWYTGRDITKDDVKQVFTNGATTTDPVTEPITLYAIWTSPEMIIGDYIKCTAAGNMDGAGSYYKLSNLVLTGYPVGEGDTPMIVAQVSVTRDTSVQDIITILNNDTANSQKLNVSGENYTYDYNGTTYYYSLKKTNDEVDMNGTEKNANTYSFYLYHMNGGTKINGWPRAALQEFLRSQVVLQPKKYTSKDTEENHYCKVRVFGTTATSN